MSDRLEGREGWLVQLRHRGVVEAPAIAGDVNKCVWQGEACSERSLRPQRHCAAVSLGPNPKYSNFTGWIWNISEMKGTSRNVQVVTTVQK
jgi:hypothetical protein